MVLETPTKRELNGVLEWLDGLEAELDAAQSNSLVRPGAQPLPSGRARIAPGVTPTERIRIWPSQNGHAPSLAYSTLGAPVGKARVGTPPKIRLPPSKTFARSGGPGVPTAQSFSGEKFVPKCFAPGEQYAASPPIVKNAAGGSRPLGPLQESNGGAQSKNQSSAPPKNQTSSQGQGYPSRTSGKPRQSLATPQSPRFQMSPRALSPRPAIPVRQRTMSPEAPQLSRQVSQQSLPVLGSPPTVATLGSQHLPSYEPDLTNPTPRLNAQGSSVQRQRTWDGTRSTNNVQLVCIETVQRTTPRVSSTLSTARRTSPREVLGSSPSVPILFNASSPQLSSAMQSARSPRPLMSSRQKSCPQLRQANAVLELEETEPIDLLEEDAPYADVSSPDLMQLCHTPKLGDEKDLALARLESALNKLDVARNRLHEVESLQDQQKPDCTNTEGRKSLPKTVGTMPCQEAGKLNLRNLSTSPPPTARPRITSPRLIVSKVLQSSEPRRSSPRASVVPPSSSPRAVAVAPRPVSRMSSGVVPASSPRHPASSPRIQPAPSPRIMSSRNCAVTPVLPMQSCTVPLVQVLRHNASTRRL